MNTPIIGKTAQPQQRTVTSSFLPPPITRLEDTGLSFLWVQDLALKIL
jgi:hypothetical protein